MTTIGWIRVCQTWHIPHRKGSTFEKFPECSFQYSCFLYGYFDRPNGKNGIWRKLYAAATSNVWIDEWPKHAANEDIAGLGNGRFPLFGQRADRRIWPPWQRRSTRSNSLLKYYGGLKIIYYACLFLPHAIFTPFYGSKNRLLHRFDASELVEATRRSGRWPNSEKWAGRNVIQIVDRRGCVLERTQTNSLDGHVGCVYHALMAVEKK